MITSFLLSILISSGAIPKDEIHVGDSIYHGVALSGVTVRGHRAGVLLKGDMSSTTFDMSMMGRMPQILGNADPLRFTQLLPGVQSNSEYDAGMYVDGCDNSHNDVTINGVTVYNAQHLLGFFSTFNASHFQSLTLQRNAVSAADANRLGGFLDMATSDTLTQHWHGSLSAGPLSSQGTVRMPLGKRSTLTVSARAAYMNLLYSQWLKHDGEQYKYFFSDYNVNWLWMPTMLDKVWIDAYYGNDKVNTDNKNRAYDINLKWKNVIAALHWQHKLGRSVLYQRLYSTFYHSKPKIKTSEYSINMPSSITDVGYHCELADSEGVVGLDVIAHNVYAQSPDASGSNFSITLSPEPRRHTFEVSAYGERDVRLYRDVLSLRCGLRLSAYHAFGGWQSGVDPLLTLRWKTHDAGVLRLTTDVKHQYVVRTGFTSLGLPSEFWMSTGGRFHAQYGWNTSLGYDLMLLERKWKLSVEAYYKRLYHQVEFVGTLFDMLYEDYSLDKELASGHGQNYGFNIMLEKRTGAVTGWVSYSFGRSRRTYHEAQLEGTFPSNHERIHELNQVAAWNPNGRWKLTETMVFASGTPFTAPVSFYMIGQNVMANFSRHNEYRLRPYFRMDLSASYTIHKSKNKESGLNFSFYNLTAHKNDIYYRLKFREGKVAYRRVRFAMPVLPSISFFYNF